MLDTTVTDHPSSEWAAQQLVEAFPYDSAPKYLVRDRDGIYGDVFKRRVRDMGINEVVISPRSPWQNPYAERVIGSIRRECLDHCIILNENHLRSILREYVYYYNHYRTHLSIDRDCPVHRPVEPREMGEVIEIPVLGGLHHRYTRQAA